MTQQHSAQAFGTRSLLWLLVLAVLLLGLSVARQQALGVLHQHTHADFQGTAPSQGTSTVTSAAAGIAQVWLSRWRQQQAFGHGQMQLGITAILAPWAPSTHHVRGHEHLQDRDPHGVESHGHQALERHHHTLGDASVIALDGAATAADAGNVAAAWLLPSFATPSLSLIFAATAARNGTWPILGAVRFATRMVLPLLRPPAV